MSFSTHLRYRVGNPVGRPIISNLWVRLGNMDFEKLKIFIPPRIIGVLERSGISTMKQIILLSKWDVQRMTKLCYDDIYLLKNTATEIMTPTSVTSDTILNDFKNMKTATGISAIDELLSGGFRKGTLTEIYGESGAGKTQIALQAAAMNWRTGCVFICTEDSFPVKRFEQLKCTIPESRNNPEFGTNIFIEHVTEANDLLACVRIRLKRLLEEYKLSLIIIDSVAAPFRCDYNNYIQRAEDMRELAISLLKLSQQYDLACVCLNQVTASLSDNHHYSVDAVLPSLGLAWSNMLSTRLWLRKTNKTISTEHSGNGHVRELEIMFAPDLPIATVKLVITSSGIQKYSC